MTYPFSSQLGWREIVVTGNINSGSIILAAKPHFRHIVRRVRGSSVGNLDLKSGSTQLGSTIVGGDNLDVPGLELKTEIGEALSIESTTIDAVDLSIQVATIRSEGPFVEE